MAQMITRCPACGTRFKVVPDQLRMSQGWVRCGHCAEIFDAARQMADAAAAALEPMPATPPPGHALPNAASAPASEPGPDALGLNGSGADVDDARPVPGPAPPPDEAPETAAAMESDLAAYVQAQAIESAQDPLWIPELHRPSADAAQDDRRSSNGEDNGQASTPASPPRLVVSLPARSVPLPMRPAASQTSDMPLPRRPATDAPVAAPAMPRRVAAPPVRAAAPVDPAHAEVSFLREAAPQAPPVHTNGPGRRMLWSASAVVALLVLLWQLALHERDRLAATAPGLRPLLDALCLPLGCRVQALRRIDAIVIDGSSFQMLGERSYRLSLTLRNRAPHPVAVPAVALSLTDIAEQPVVRRVLLPQDFGTPPDALQAHGEWAASVELQVAENAGAARVVGYRIDPFYP